MLRRPIYITTPIYYVNDKPHLGHAYATIFADILHRTYELIGRETFFLTGTDEHGQKVYQAAKKLGQSPEQHVEQYHRRFIEIWDELNIGYNHFIRTTDSEHVKYVQWALQKLFKQQDIYQKEYEGWYSVGEERFFSEDELIDGRDPISGKTVEWVSEINYFFRMSKYQKNLQDYLTSHTDFILPKIRMNEVQSFLKKPLGDLCISRPKKRLPWGIELPFDKSYVTYVWFDALLNYLSAVENKTWTHSSPAESIWPSYAHIIGKDIVITHGVYFPTMLFALDLPLPKHLIAHGWWLQKGTKMSKSAGNTIDPLSLLNKEITRDYCRYFLCREMPLGHDISYDRETLKRCINGDLANGLGNTLSRLHKMAKSVNPDGRWQLNKIQQKFFRARDINWNSYHVYLETCLHPQSSPQQTSQGIFHETIALPHFHHIDQSIDFKELGFSDPKIAQNICQELGKLIDYCELDLVWNSLPTHLANFDLSFLLKDIQEVVVKISSLLEKTEPWKLNTKQHICLLNTLLYPCFEALRVCFILLTPVMPEQSKAALNVIGYTQNNHSSTDLPTFAWGQLPAVINIANTANIFPRFDA